MKVMKAFYFKQTLLGELIQKGTTVVESDLSPRQNILPRIRTCDLKKVKLSIPKAPGIKIWIRSETQKKHVLSEYKK